MGKVIEEAIEADRGSKGVPNLPYLLALHHIVGAAFGWESISSTQPKLVLANVSPAIQRSAQNLVHRLVAYAPPVGECVSKHVLLLFVWVCIAMVL